MRKNSGRIDKGNISDKVDETAGKSFLTPGRVFNEEDDEIISASQQKRIDKVLQDYFKALKDFEKQHSSNPASATEVKFLLDDYELKLQNKTDLFASDPDNKDKNIFNYLVFIKFENSLISLFNDLVKVNKIEILKHTLGREARELTLIEYAILKGNISYAYLIAKTLIQKSQLSEFTKNIQYTQIQSSSNEYFNSNFKKFNYLLVWYILDNFTTYPEQHHSKLTEFIIDLINNDLIIKFVEGIDAGKNRLPILHKMVLLANQSYACSRKIIESIKDEKFRELEKECNCYEDVLLTAVYSIKQESGLAILDILMKDKKLDPLLATNGHSSNIIHKLFRNSKTSLIPKILNILVTKIEEKALLDLFYAEDIDGNTPLAAAIKYVSNSPKKHSPSEIIKGIKQITTTFPNLCKNPLDKDKNTLILLCIKFEQFRAIVSEIINFSNLDFKNILGESARSLAKIVGISLEPSAADQQLSYYIPRRQFEELQEQNDQLEKNVKKIGLKRDQLNNELEDECHTAKRLRTERNDYKETSDSQQKDLERIRDERNDLKEKLDKANQEIIKIRAENEKYRQDNYKNKNMIEEMTNQLKESTKAKEKVTSDLENIKPKHQVLLDKIDAQTVELQQYKKLYEDEEIKNKDLTEQLVNKEVELDTLQNTNHSLNLRIQELEKIYQQESTKNKFAKQEFINELETQKEIYQKIKAEKEELERQLAQTSINPSIKLGNIQKHLSRNTSAFFVGNIIDKNATIENEGGSKKKQRTEPLNSFSAMISNSIDLSSISRANSEITLNPENSTQIVPAQTEVQAQEKHVSEIEKANNVHGVEDLSDIEDGELENSEEAQEAKPKNEISNQEKEKIGLAGEKYIYSMFFRKYQQAYNSDPVETKQGFKVTGKCSKHGNQKEVEIIWHGKKTSELKIGEGINISPEEYMTKITAKNTKATLDMLIKTKRNDIQKPKRYVEIKSTKEKEKSPAELSRKQLKAMRKCKTQFSLYRVYNALTLGAAYHKEFKDPYKEILQEPKLSKEIYSIKIRI